MIRRLKLVITTVMGFTVIAIGAAMLVLPGPGLVVIGLGLLILSAEFVWARRALDRAGQRTFEIDGDRELLARV
jgi:tellurite resistance protein TerC